MAHFADPNRCPDCAGPITGPVCRTCGLRLVGTTAGELFSTLQHADVLLERLRTETVEAHATPAPVQPPAQPPVRPPVQMAQAPRRSTTVPAVLLTLGAIALAAGALVFVVAAWFVLGAGGRTVALVLLTAGLGCATWIATKRDLRAAAETLGTLTALFIGFDLIGMRLAWFHESDLRPYAIAAGLLLAATCVGGVVALRERLRLWGPEVIAAIGLVVAAVAVLATDEHVPVAMGTVMVVGAAVAWSARRISLPVVAISALVLALVGWLLLVAYGVFSAVDDQRAASSAIGPLAVAGLAAVAVAVVLPFAREVAGTIGAWLVVGAAVGWTDWFQTPTWGLLTVTVVAAAGYAVWTGPGRRTGIGVGLVGTLVLLVAAAAWVEELVSALVDAGAQGWATRFVVDSDVPPWTAVVAFGLVAALAVRLWGLRRDLSLATAGVVGLGLTTAGYAHWTLVPAGFALAAALLESAVALRGSQRHWAAAGLLGVAAVGCAATGSGPESVVWWAAAVVGAVVLLQGRTPDRVVAAALVPVAVAGALVLDGDAFDLERRWVGLGAAVLVYGAALALRPRAAGAARPALAGGTLVAMLASVAVGATSTGWLAAELTVVAAACAVASILDRSRIEGAVATAFGLAALWLRLGASDVHTPEAYSLPLAAVVLLVGGWAMWHDESRRTLPTIGTGLALALVPTWALGIAHPLSVRALVAGVACGALVAAGAQLRWMAPLLLGGVAGTLLALVEIAPYADAVPRWVLLVGIGAALLAAGVRWEVLATAGRRTWGRLAELR